MFSRHIAVGAALFGALVMTMGTAHADVIGELYFFENGSDIGVVAPPGATQHGVVASSCWLGQGCYLDRQSPTQTAGETLTTTFSVGTMFGGFQTAVGQDYKFNFYDGSTLSDTMEFVTTGQGPTTDTIIGTFISGDDESGLTALVGGTNIDESTFTPFGAYSYWSSPDLFLATCGEITCNLRVGFGTGPDVSDIPEPVTLSFFGAGLAGAAALRRRKKKIA